MPAQSPPAWAPPSTALVPGTPGTATLAYQFSGAAFWSILFGLASVIVPILTPIYFPILPFFGIWRGVLAIRAGRVVGGVVGLVLNGLGVIVSVLSSGLLR